MIKPKGCEYDDNEYHGPPITNPNPGKGKTLADMVMQGSVSDSFMRSVLNADTVGGYNNLLSVIPPGVEFRPTVQEQAYYLDHVRINELELQGYQRLRTRDEEYRERLNGEGGSIVNGAADTSAWFTYDQRRAVLHSNPELVIQERKEELAVLYTRYGRVIPTWATALNPVYRDIPIEQYTREDWLVVLARLAQMMEQNLAGAEAVRRFLT